MKLLFAISLIFLVGCSETKELLSSPYDKAKAEAVGFAVSLKTGDCFRYEDDRKAEFSFEKDYRYVGHTYTVIARDTEALLIAQPEPECGAPADQSHLCEYWFRTVPFNDMFLIHGKEKKVECPSQLSLRNMTERLKKSEYSNRYKL